MSPSVFETPSDGDLILPERFTIISSSLNVQPHTEAEFNKAIDTLGAGLIIFKAEEYDSILMGGIPLGTQRGFAAEQEVVFKLSQQIEMPVSTAIGATIEALKQLRVKTTVIAASYKESINQAVKKYYAGGVKVLASEGLAVSKPVDQVELPDYSSHKVASELFRAHPEVESLLPQSHWRTIAYMQQLENDIDRFVVSSAAASIRWVMKTLG